MNKDQSILNINPSDYGIEFKPFIKLTKKQLQYVENAWHHAVLTEYGLKPCDDERYNSFDFEFKETLHIIKSYGVKPPKYMRGFWDYSEKYYGVEIPDECLHNDDKLIQYAIDLTQIQSSKS